VVAGRGAVLDTFVGAGVINFLRFDRDIEFIRADGPYVIGYGLGDDSASDGRASRGSGGRANDPAQVYKRLERGRWV
jgi:hypothetical protein